MSLNLRIKTRDIVLYAIFIAIIKTHSIPQTIQQVFKIMLLIIAGIYLIKNVKLNRIINTATLIGCPVIISSVVGYLEGVVGIQSIFNGILHAICLFEIYLIVLCYKKSGKYNELCDALFFICSVFCFISILSILIRGHSSHGTEIMYFFGSKFMTSYLFIFWLVLFRAKFAKRIESQRKYKVLYFTLVLVVILICYYLYCITAVLGTAFLVLEIFFPKHLRKFFANPIVIILAVFFAGIFPFFINSILNNAYIMHLITDVFHKNPNLTGREIIFNRLLYIIGLRKILGFGYGNEIVAQIVGFGNAQNGLMQYVVDYGVLGMITFFIGIFNSVRKHTYNEKLSGWYAFLYVLIICSTVEISFNYIFFLTLFVIGNAKKEPETHFLGVRILKNN